MSAPLVAQLLVLVLFAATAGLLGPCDERRKWLETVVPRFVSAEAQLAHARQLKRRLADKEGEELVAWRKLTVEAYRAVRVFHPGAEACGVEAAFRAGELLRAGGDASGALDEFHWSARHGQGSEFRARAGLEIGHVHRRAERWSQALEAYLEVAADAAASAPHREDAWLWAGTVWQAEGRVEDACRAWRRVAEKGLDPLARVQAFDELGMQRLAEADLEGAAGTLDQCLRALSPHALEETERGERVRNALLRMRIVEELPRAIVRRNGLQSSSRNSEKVLTR